VVGAPSDPRSMRLIGVVSDQEEEAGGGVDMAYDFGFSGYGYNPYKNLRTMYSRNWNNAKQFFGDISGYNQYQQTKASNQAQIDYDNYIKAANERALADWHRNVPNREIAYPELSYAGAIYRASTGIARSYYSNDSALSNFAGNVAYRAAGLYGVAGHLSRRL